MQRVPSPEISYADVFVALNGTVYKLTYRWNERSERWKLDLSTSEEVPIIYGLTLMEEEILNAHLTLPEFRDGLLIVDKSNATTEPVGRNNIGIGNDYELIYVTKSELE